MDGDICAPLGQLWGVTPVPFVEVTHFVIVFEEIYCRCSSTEIKEMVRILPPFQLPSPTNSLGPSPRYHYQYGHLHNGAGGGGGHIVRNKGVIRRKPNKSTAV